MTEAADNSNAIIRPPIAWALAFIAGLALDSLYPLRFVPAAVPAALVGGAVFAAGPVLVIWAIVTIRKAGSRIETNKPTTAIVAGGPYRFTRNPIYIGMFLGQTGLGIGFDSLWVLAMLVPFYLVIRYGVVAREEAYLEASSVMSTVATARAYGAGCSTAARCAFLRGLSTAVCGAARRIGLARRAASDARSR